MSQKHSSAARASEKTASPAKRKTKPPTQNRGGQGDDHHQSTSSQPRPTPQNRPNRVNMRKPGAQGLARQSAFPVGNNQGSQQYIQQRPIPRPMPPQTPFFSDAPNRTPNHPRPGSSPAKNKNNDYYDQSAAFASYGASGPQARLWSGDFEPDRTVNSHGQTVPLASASTPIDSQPLVSAPDSLDVTDQTATLIDLTQNCSSSFGSFTPARPSSPTGWDMPLLSRPTLVPEGEWRPEMEIASYDIEAWRRTSAQASSVDPDEYIDKVKDDERDAVATTSSEIDQSREEGITGRVADVQLAEASVTLTPAQTESPVASQGDRPNNTVVPAIENVIQGSHWSNANDDQRENVKITLIDISPTLQPDRPSKLTGTLDIFSSLAEIDATCNLTPALLDISTAANLQPLESNSTKVLAEIESNNPNSTTQVTHSVARFASETPSVIDLFASQPLPGMASAPQTPTCLKQKRLYALSDSMWLKGNTGLQTPQPEKRSLQGQEHPKKDGEQQRHGQTSQTTYLSRQSKPPLHHGHHHHHHQQQQNRQLATWQQPPQQAFSSSTMFSSTHSNQGTGHHPPLHDQSGHRSHPVQHWDDSQTFELTEETPIIKAATAPAPVPTATTTKTMVSTSTQTVPAITAPTASLQMATAIATASTTLIETTTTTTTLTAAPTDKATTQITTAASTLSLSSPPHVVSSNVTRSTMECRRYDRAFLMEFSDVSIFPSQMPQEVLKEERQVEGERASRLENGDEAVQSKGNSKSSDEVVVLKATIAQSSTKDAVTGGHEEISGNGSFKNNQGTAKQHDDRVNPIRQPIGPSSLTAKGFTLFRRS